MLSSHTPAQLRRQSHITLDTPTPAPSSGHSSIITSLKPARSRSSLSGDFRNSRNTFKPFIATTTQPQPALRPLAHSSGRQLNIPDINTNDLNLDHLEIQTDGTERKRRTLEEEIRRGMGELGQRSQSEQSSSQSQSGESVGYGDMSDVDAPSAMRSFADRIADETTESGSESLGDDFSLRIGMAGSRGMAPGPAAGRPNSHLDHHHDGSSASQSEDEEDLQERSLTYQTVRGGAESLASPPTARQQNNNNKAPTPPPPASNPPLSFARTQFFKHPPPPSSIALPSPAPPTSAMRVNPAVFNDENRPPGPSPSFRPRPTFANLHSTTIPTVHRPYFTSSPLSPATVRAPNNSRQTTAAPQSAGRMRLPDVTGITEGLRSPLKARGHYAVAPGAATSDEAVINGALSQLKERLARLERENSLSAARVRELETKLQDEEHEASVRAPSVAREAIGDDWQEKLQEEQDRRQGLEDEVTRLRSQVAHLAHSLKSHTEALNELHAHQRESSSATHLPVQALEAEVSSLRTGLDDLGAEVEAVRNVVDELVREREAHAAVEWEKEEEERKRSMEQRQREPEVLEGMARRSMGREERGRRSPAPAPVTQARMSESYTEGYKAGRKEGSGSVGVEDPDRTPRANRTYAFGKRTGPGTPQSERSFHSREEIEQLRQSILKEAARTSSPQPHQHKPSPPKEQRRQKQQTHFANFEAPTRPSTAPLPTRRPSPPVAPRHHESYDSHLSSRTPHHHATSRPQERPKEVHHQAASSHHSAEYQSRSSDELDARAERVFDSVKAVNSSADLCTICRKRRTGTGRSEQRAFGSAPPKLQRVPVPETVGTKSETEYEADVEVQIEREETVPVVMAQQKSRKDRQATVDRALKVLEEDFEAHKRIYVELSNEYRGMDSRVEGVKRKVLSNHLKESIDTLELKAEQIRDMHDLLHPAIIAPTPQRAKTFGAGRMRECVV
ncbi:hypothetical protein P7C70_g3935, partial [Phenoliferia sp. Uapishka_3]